MTVLNTFEHDTRVLKQARSLARWRFDVVVLARSGPGLPARETLEPSLVVERVGLDRREPLDVARAVLARHRDPARVRRLVDGPPIGAAPSPVAAAPTTPRSPVRRTADRITRTTSTRLRRIPARLRRSAADRVRRLRHPVISSLSFSGAFARRALALAPDVMLCHDLNTLAAGAIVKSLTGARLAYDSHELWLERNIGDRSRRWDRLGWAWLERRLVKDCDLVTTVAEGICDELRDRYRIPRPALIRNVQPWEPPPARTRILSEELGLPASRPIVLYPGAITINRGLEQAIDAAVLFEDAALVIMGYARDAAYLASLRDRAEGHGVLGRTVFFRDAVPPDEVARYTASADLGIVPTQNACRSYLFEASNKIFHCLMAGVPFVGSDHPEKRLLIERHGVGRTFDETDPVAIARTVRELLADARELERMRAACLEAARTLNWEQEETRLRRLYGELAAIPATGTDVEITPGGATAAATGATAPRPTGPGTALPLQTRSP